MEDPYLKPSWYQPVAPLEVTGTEISLYIKHENGIYRLMNV